MSLGLAPLLLMFAGCGGGGGDSGPAPTPRFTLPTAVAFGSNFNDIVQGKAVDQTCTVGSGSGDMGAADVAGVVVSCGPATFSVSTLAGSGSAGSANGSGAVAQFRAPYGVAFDSSGNVLVADTGNHKIRRITQD